MSDDHSEVCGHEADVMGTDRTCDLPVGHTGPHMRRENGDMRQGWWDDAPPPRNTETPVTWVPGVGLLRRTTQEAQYMVPRVVAEAFAEQDAKDYVALVSADATASSNAFEGANDQSADEVTDPEALLESAQASPSDVLLENEPDDGDDELAEDGG